MPADELIKEFSSAMNRVGSDVTHEEILKAWIGIQSDDIIDAQHTLVGIYDNSPAGELHVNLILFGIWLAKRSQNSL